MLLFLVMDPAEDGKALEDQWEKWMTNDFSLSEYEDEDLSELTEMTEQRRQQEDDDDDDADADDVTLWLANDHAGREREGCVRSASLELIDAEEIEEEGEEREVEEGGGGLVQAAERRRRLEKEGEEEEEEEEEEQEEQEEGGRKLSPLKGGSTCAVMDKYRPKRPTTLALFPQLPQAGTQDSINNNSLGKKDSWKDSRSSSPHITGDRAAQDIKPKAEDKVRLCSRRPAPKPPLVNGANSRANSHSAAGDTRARPRERQPSGATNTARSQRTAPAAARGRGAGRAATATAMRERNSAHVPGKDAAAAPKEERKGGRLCEGTKDKPQSHQRPRESSAIKSNGNDAKGKVCAKGDNRGGKVKLSNALSNQEVYLTAMVVPRTPVAPRNKDKSQEQGQNHDRSQENPPALSRSSSEGGSNRMSLSSDTEGPPPGPLNPSLTHRTNPDIREEEGEGAPSPCVNIQDHPKHCPQAPEATKTERSKSGGGQGDRKSKADSGTWLTQGGPAAAAAAAAAAQTVPKSEASAGLNYDSVKYTLVVDEHAQLELVSLKDCLHVYPQHNEDSDAETVYQSANEEEDPEYKEERKKKEEAKKQESQREEEKKRRDEEEKRKRREEDLKRRREEEVKRRREVVARVWKHSKVASDAAAEEEESTGGKAPAPTSRKFLNLFANDSSNYSAAGAGSFGVFSCVLDGVEREQSHRAAYRFVPRHADELHLETDDPLLILKQSEDLWCQGYNMRSGATGIFPAFYAVKVAKENNKVQTDGWIEQFTVRFLGSVQVPIHKGNDVLCAAMQKVAYNRRLAGQPPASCVLEVSVRGVKISVQDQCHSAHRGDQCFHFFQLKNISFCGCHPKHSKYFGFITKHPDQQRFACHVMMAEKTLHPLAESVGKAFQQYYKEHIGYSCPTEDIFLE